MSRRNLNLLLAISIVSFACYKKADSAYRSHYGRMFGTFVEVLSQIDAHYVEKVDDRDLFEGALTGMVKRLDPYSAYIPPAESTEFRESLDQQFGGIGIEVSWDPQTKLLTVLSPLVGSPAYDAGILAGDKILLIDGESTEGFNIQDAVQRLKGQPGEPVRLTVLHEGDSRPVDIDLKRAIIEVDTVLGDTRAADGSWNFFLNDTKIGYIRVVGFGERTTSELQRALAHLAREKAEGLVLDLRYNAGGLLKSATSTCDLFIKRGRIVSTRGRDRTDREVFEASGNAPYADLPLVVLMNRFSASASEVVAACLQDHGRAAVVGERSFGKGTVQNVIPLEEGKSVLKLTIATYWRPSDRNIDRGKNAKEEDAWGVTPNPGLEVKLTDEELRRVVEERRQRDVVRRPGSVQSVQTDPPFDPQLQKALDYLKNKGGATKAE
ncbi:MAG: S41 family peptidase [Pirellulales bacterium]